MDTFADDFDPYETLGLSNLASTREEISKASRKLGLKFHPDKNPDPAAHTKFLAIQRAKELLLDEKRRKDYDSKRSAREKRKRFDEEQGAKMDSKRKRFRANLEKKISDQKNSMNQANTPGTGPRPTKEPDIPLSTSSSLPSEDLKRRENGEKILAEMLDHRKKMAASSSAVKSASTYTEGQHLEPDATDIKVKWKRTGMSQSEDSLYQLFKCYGNIEEVRLTGSKGTSAVISYGGVKSNEAAMAAVAAMANNEHLKVIVVGEDKDVAKRAAVFTHKFTKVNVEANPSVATAAASTTYGKTGLKSGVERELVRDIARVVERQNLLRVVETMEASRAAEVIEKERGGGSFDLASFWGLSFEQVMEREGAFLAHLKTLN